MELGTWACGGSDWDGVLHIHGQSIRRNLTSHVHWQRNDIHSHSHSHSHTIRHTGERRERYAPTLVQHNSPSALNIV